MLRTVTLGLALLVLAEACASTTPPSPPPGTLEVHADVISEKGNVELSVVTPAGPLPGAVQLQEQVSDSRGVVTFYVPAGGEYWITVNGQPEITKADIDQYFRHKCVLLIIELLAGGGNKSHCSVPQIP